MRSRFRCVLMALSIASTVVVLAFMVSTGCSVSPRRLVVSSGPGSAGNSEFTISVTPTSQIITAGSIGSYTVTVQAVNGFTGTVSLSATATNSNVVTNFNPPSVNGSGTSTLTVTTSSSTPAVTSSISVTGADSNSGQQSSVSVTAVIQAGPGTAGATVPAECVSAAAGAGPQISAFPSSHNTGFSATFSATPSRAPIDAAIGFSSRNPVGQPVFAGLVRFSPSGTIQVRDGDAFSASTRVPFAAGETYRFRLVENLPAVTYTVFVTPPGVMELLVGANLQVPAEQRGAASLNGWGALVSSPAGAELNVCNLERF